jgi:mono/diheme cytochrome c family protein
MKYLITLLLAIILTMASCAVSQAKVTYEFPDAMSENVRTEYIKLCEKGKVLYDINCAGCHNIKKGRQELIPDFTPEQLKGYEIRVLNSEHEENMPDEKVTAEELGLISTFLLYKKKMGLKG